MPSSFVANIPEIVVAVADMRPRPRSILDVGVGFGKYGLLLREYLPRGRRIDGIEVWPEYLAQGWQFHVYDRLYVGDVRDGLAFGHYDVALLVDIVEHFEQAESRAVVERIAEHADQLVISTPRRIGRRYRGPNPHELHRCLWTEDLLAELATAHGWTYRLIPSRRSILAVVDTRPPA